MYVEDGQKILNIACYDSFAFPTTLECVEKSLKYFVKHYKEYNITEIAFPLLGCDEDGLRMVNVLPLMEKYLKPLPIDCYICFDVLGPSNLEEQMIRAFNEMNPLHLALYAKLDKIQVSSLVANKDNIFRFEDILHIPSIDVSSYRLIYSYFYNGEYKKLNPFHQESLF